MAALRYRSVVAGMAMMALAACTANGDDSAGASQRDSAPAPTVTTASTGTTAAGGNDAGRAPGRAPVLATDLADGSHPAYLTGVDLSARTITFDVVRWSEGDEGVAYSNENAKLRTASVADDV